MILPFYLLVFASTYFLMQRASAANFTQPLTRTDALYFSVTVFSTVGFGDITPKSEAARVVLIVQMLGDLALLGAGEGPAGGRAPRPATTGHERPGRPGGRVRAARTGPAGRWTCAHRKAPRIGAVALAAPISAGRSADNSRLAQICEVVLLRLVTVTAAWAGYSAAKGFRTAPDRAGRAVHEAHHQPSLLPACAPTLLALSWQRRPSEGTVPRRQGGVGLQRTGRGPADRPRAADQGRHHGAMPSISVSSEKLRNVLITTISPSCRTLLRVGATAMVQLDRAPEVKGIRRQLAELASAGRAAA